MEEKKERGVNIEDLPQAEQELSADEAKEVQGGLTAGTYGRGVTVAAGDVNGDRPDVLGAGPGAGPHVKQ